MSNGKRAVWLPVCLITFLACLAGFSDLAAQDKKILLTFDGLPAVKPMGFWRPREISNMILKALAAHGVKAAGFVIGEKIEDDPAGVIVLQDWLAKGHTLGNQTFGNADLNELEPEDFLLHVTDGERHLMAASRGTRSNFRYLRFPQLHEGNTERKKKWVRYGLRHEEYDIVPVTVKTSDYRFNRPYLERQNSPEALAPLKEAYIRHIGRMLDYAEKQSQAVLGQDITQILWLRAGIATAGFMEDLLKMLQERGYRFVSLTEALSDPGFKTEEKYAGPLGLSFLDRVAATRGLPFDANHGDIADAETEKLLETTD